ncbi:hypothetical protein K474DRAFT_1691312 [Panus rudis PR-1116 ss-1]|nr:hypothetical protein K474DRAFT_1691312 [Panus rudis PR-1116 ss-1]
MSRQPSSLAGGAASPHSPLKAAASNPEIDYNLSTPPRGRSSARYPATLGLGEPGRVPLHRRGKSKTYEALEDLLREAGYKDTRIFTPESERADKRAAEERRERDNAGQRAGSIRGGVGAVVGFLAGWMPGVARTEDEESSSVARPGVDEDPRMQERSLPASPLAHKHPELVASKSPRYNSASPRVRVHQLPVPQYPQYSPMPDRPFQVLRHQPSASSSLRAYAQVSAARGYLRHMASAPTIPKRVPSNRDIVVKRRTIMVHDASDAPAMPANWLGHVTKAVLGSSNTDAYVGGPMQRPSSRQSNRVPYRSRPGTALSDHTNQLSSRNLARNASSSVLPHTLTFHPQRALAVPGEVTVAQVVCRSAPASRSSSRVGDRLVHATGSNKRKHPHRKSNGAKPDTVPSLIATSPENDAWAPRWVNGQRISTTFHNEHDNNDDDDTDDDDDEGELDLARILMPPKRQNSIRSLRRHLHHCDSMRSRRERHLPALDPFAFDDDDGVGRRASLEESPGWYEQPGTKKRRGIPGVWSHLAASRS